MTMDILFLMSPNFTDALRDQEGTLYYCPDCALEKVLLAILCGSNSQIASYNCGSGFTVNGNN